MVKKKSVGKINKKGQTDINVIVAILFILAGISIFLKNINVGFILGGIAFLIEPIRQIIIKGGLS